MNTFLQYVVNETLNLNIELERLVYVLPTQRAGVYLKKNLENKLHHVTFFPEITTFDNLVEVINGQNKTNSIELLFEFYEVYKSIIPKDKIEPFESFISWAKIILDDFNEIDNNLVIPENIFHTLKSIHDIQLLLSENVAQNHYLEFIQHIDLYYNKLNDALREKGKNYQGMLYRNVINELEHFKKHTSKFYIFVGCSLLKKSEELIIEELVLENKAKIFWDISQSFMSEIFNKNSFFHRYFSQWQIYKEVPFSDFYFSELDINKIKIIGVPKKIGMVKYASQLLANETTVKDNTVIFNDQNIVSSLLQSLPPHVDKVNITMGIPLKNFPITDLLHSLLYLHVNNLNRQKGFYYKNVLKVLKNQVFAQINFSFQPILEKLIASNSVFITHADLKNAFNDEKSEFTDRLLKLFEDYSNSKYITLLEAVNQFIVLLKSENNSVENEILFQNYTIIQNLSRLISQYNVLSDLKSIRMVLQKLTSTEHLNFYGEPFQGLQLMGFLETQVLDFTKTYLLSVNENILPKNKFTDTFIPFDVRKHYGLTTYQEKEMLDKYLFYRILDKSEQVTIFYNSDLDSFGKGEKSRFIEQLLWHYPDIKHAQIDSKNAFTPIEAKKIIKNDTSIPLIKNLLQTGISPSALATYIYNPIEFYKQKILNIKETSAIEETVAENTLGTVVHAVLEKIYQAFVGKYVDVNILKNDLKELHALTTQAFQNELKNTNINEGKNKLIFEVALNFINRFIQNEINEIENGNTIKIIGLEQKISSEYHFNSIEFPVKFKGIIDRIDEFNETIRIIDYKTGSVTPAQLKANHFNEKIKDYKYSKALQVLLYSCMYSAQNEINNKFLNAGIISFKKHKNGFMPVNFGEKNNEKDYLITYERQQQFLYEIELLLLEILDINIPFEEKTN